MIDREYLSSILVWGVMIGCAVGVAFLIVPISRRRRVVYSTLGFTIPLSILGFVDGVSKQLGLVPCSGGVVLIEINSFNGKPKALASEMVTRRRLRLTVKRKNQHLFIERSLASFFNKHE